MKPALCILLFWCCHALPSVDFQYASVHFSYEMELIYWWICMWPVNLCSWYSKVCPTTWSTLLYVNTDGFLHWGKYAKFPESHWIPQISCSAFQLALHDSIHWGEDENNLKHSRRLFPMLIHVMPSIHVQGWALYSEALGEEYGAYKDSLSL